MDKLQRYWYNTLTSYLNLDRKKFQIYHYFDPIIETTEKLWSYQNTLPPEVLTYNPSFFPKPVQSFGNQYGKIVTQLEYPPIYLKKEIGEKNYEKWEAYLKTLSPTPSEIKLPTIFRQWATKFAPDVANIGASTLTRIALINRAAKSFQKYQGPNAKPFDFTSNYDSLLNTLNHSMEASLLFDSKTGSDNIDDTWAKPSDKLFGLWADNETDESINNQFAASNITVKTEFRKFVIYPSVPGFWYNSSALSTAYSNKNTAPWPKDPKPGWEDFFGAQGSLKRIISNLVIADELDITVTSDAIFSKNEQILITDNAHKGLWPFYIPNANTVNFDDGMTIETMTERDQPVLIGNYVMSINQYLGFE